MSSCVFASKEKSLIALATCLIFFKTSFSSPPTEAVRRFFYKQDWCVVVVGDLNKPKVRFVLSLVKIELKVRSLFNCVNLL